MTVATQKMKIDVSSEIFHAALSSMLIRLRCGGWNVLCMYIYALLKRLALPYKHIQILVAYKPILSAIACFGSSSNIIVIATA